MEHVGAWIYMAYIEVENATTAMIGGLLIAKGVLETLKALLHGHLPELGFRTC
jgi:hypothetical protein